jgi:hypothetical protein
MTGDPATREWQQVIARDEKHTCAWRELAEKARAERDEARAALADYLRKEATDA